MFKAHILVNEDTDVAGEMATLEQLAQMHRLGDTKTFVMMKNVESVLADLKQKDSETAAYGIKMEVKKTVETADYQIALELRPRRDGKPKKGGLLSWLLGR